MHADDVLSLGLGVTPPWKLVGQRLDTDKRPNELHIEVAADRGAWEVPARLVEQPSRKRPLVGRAPDLGGATLHANLEAVAFQRIDRGDAQGDPGFSPAPAASAAASGAQGPVRMLRGCAPPAPCA